MTNRTPTLPLRPSDLLPAAVRVTVLAAVLAGAGLVLTVYVTLSGGIDELFKGTAPRHGDPEVVAARQAAGAWFPAEASRVAADVVAPALGSSPHLGSQGALLGTGDRAAPCQVGEHDWKVDDDFDLVCELEAVRVLAGPAWSDRVRPRDAVEAALRRDGWMSATNHSFGDLPTLWTKRSGGLLMILEVAWVDRRSETFDVGHQWDPDWAAAVRDPDVEGAGSSAVVLDQTVEYFRE